MGADGWEHHRRPGAGVEPMDMVFTSSAQQKDGAPRTLSGHLHHYTVDELGTVSATVVRRREHDSVRNLLNEIGRAHV